MVLKTKLHESFLKGQILIKKCFSGRVGWIEILKEVRFIREDVPSKVLSIKS